MALEHDLLNAIMDSKNMSVGGGSASALAGGMAAALVAMVAKLSINKNYGLANKEYENIVKEADRLKTSLIKGAEDDANAYSLIIKAYRLPQVPLEEKSRRAKEIEKAYIEATVVPQNNALLARQIIEHCNLLEKNSNPSAASDLKVAKLLAYAGLMGCLANMQINIDSIKSKRVSLKLKEKLEDLKHSSKPPSV